MGRVFEKVRRGAHVIPGTKKISAGIPFANDASGVIISMDLFRVIARVIMPYATEMYINIFMAEKFETRT